MTKVAVGLYLRHLGNQEGNYSAYVPDLPGCVATGATLQAVEQAIREAIRMHVDGMIEDGLTVPAPTSLAEYVEA